jgi:hypothetical protein
VSTASINAVSMLDAVILRTRTSGCSWASAETGDVAATAIDRLRRTSREALQIT